VALVELGAVIRRLVGHRGDVARVVFRDRGRRFDCLVPDDNLWGALTENVLLRQYEEAGIDLSVHRKLVVDAGAHVGLFALRVDADKVLALEPVESNAELLERNLRANGARSVEHIRQALWEHSCNDLFYQATQSGGGSLIRKEGCRSWSVGTTTLDAIVRRHGHIDLLKLDIEGAECRVLAAASDRALEMVSAITAELHPECEDKRLVADRLRRLGFRVTVLDSPFHYPKATLRRLVANSRKLDGYTRLKLVACAVYGLGGLAVTLWPTLERPRLGFLFAVRD
jgi:FkbM family methyltransferase